MVAKIPVALTVGGSDSGGGAGIVADLMTFAAHQVFGSVAIAAVTAQNSREISKVEMISPETVAAQIHAVFSDLAPAAVKVGMLGSARNVSAVAKALRRNRARNVVIDPLLESTSGKPLLPRAAIAIMKKELFPLALLVTPNLPETEALVGFAVTNDEDRRLAAGMLLEMGPAAVLIKGGHGGDRQISDLLYDGKRFVEFRNFRIETKAVHGTGCTLSAAIAANLARGATLANAVRAGIEYLRQSLRRGLFPGSGDGSPGHF